MSEHINLKYVMREEASHVSYGSKAGNFIIDSDTLKLLAESDYHLKNFCFVEVKTEYYILMFDFDFHPTKTNSIEYIPKADAIVDHVIKLINKTLKKVFVEPDISFVYCDKNIDKGVHLYYPGIVVDKSIHQYIYNDVIIQLVNQNTFKLTGENWKDIFDACITKANGLRFPYFLKDSTYYKVNKDKSICDIPTTRYERIKLCSIRSKRTSEYPELKIAINKNSFEKTKLSKKEKTNAEKFVEPQEHKIIQHISIQELDGLLGCFKKEMFMNYDDWHTMGWYIFNCNNAEDACKLFHKYSKVGKYEDIPYSIIKKKFSEYKISNYFNPNILRYQARKENFKLFDKLALKIEYDKREFQAIQFNDKKIINIDKDGKETFIQTEIDKYVKSKDVFFALKAAYGTGKTTMIEHICKKYDYERILIATHRQSLAVDFVKIFKKLGFDNYLDKSTFSSKSDRLIVNIDSLHLLKEEYNFFTEKSNLREFDLIVLDECESLFKHFESSLMNSNKDYIYSIFHDLVGNTKKVICMDGDLSNRSYHYLKRFDQNIKIYENTHIPRKYKFTIGYDERVYVDTIAKDLENGLNCVVVSMSSQFCEKIKKRFEKEYDTLMIIGKSDDALKKQMVDPVKVLKKVQLFIYSPCITVGVDISFKHFDKIYGFVCNYSVTSRDFMQMLARIRNPTSSLIYLLIDNTIPRSQIANYYEFEEIKLIYAQKYNYNPNDLTTYQILRLWNKFEDLNNKLYLFPLLLNYIQQKGHTYEIKNEKSYKIHDNLLADDIVNAKNIDEDEYEELLEKQQDGIIRQDERLSIEKYLYAKTFKIDIENVNSKFMKTHYGKINIVFNNNIFIKYLNGQLDEKLHNNKFDNQNKLQKVKYIKDIINELGFDKLNDQVKKSEFDENIPGMLKLIDSKFRLSFDMKKEEVDRLGKKYDTNKKILGFINKLIGEYGVTIKTVRKSKYNKTTKKKDITLTSHFKFVNIKILFF